MFRDFYKFVELIADKQYFVNNTTDKQYFVNNTMIYSLNATAYLNCGLRSSSVFISLLINTFYRVPRFLLFF